MSETLPGEFKRQEVVWSRRFDKAQYDKDLQIGDRGEVLGFKDNGKKVLILVKFDKSGLWYVFPTDISREKLPKNLAGSFNPPEVVWSRISCKDQSTGKDLQIGCRGEVQGFATNGNIEQILVKFDKSGSWNLLPKQISRQKLSLPSVVEDENTDENASREGLPKRVTDVALEKLSAMPPIFGVMKTTLLPLERAIAKTGLSKMEAFVFSSKMKGEQSTEKDLFGLSSDEIAAIWLYTCESPLYGTLNELLREEHRAKLKPFFYYLRILLPGLKKIKAVKTTVYRGVKKDLSKIYEEQKGKFITWAAISSTSRTIETLTSDQFCGQKGPRTLFTIEVSTGIPISKYSLYPNESEILLLPMTVFKVIAVLPLGNGLTQVQLKEKADINMIE